MNFAVASGKRTRSRGLVSQIWVGLLALLGVMWLALAHAANDPNASVSAALDQTAALKFSQSVIGKPVGDHRFTDRNGQTLRLSQFRGKPLLVSFVYTGCFQVCPTTTRFLAKSVTAAQQAMGKDAFQTITIGFNLPYDSPQAMKTFAKQQGIDQPNWEFLTPDAATLQQLTQDFGFTFIATPKGFDHITQVTVVDAEGKVFRQVYGESFEIPMLIGPLKELLTGAPSPVQNMDELIERVRLFCTVYDPRSGTYQLNYGLFIEILVGVVVLGSTLWFLIAEWRRYRRTHKASV